MMVVRWIVFFFALLLLGGCGTSTSAPKKSYPIEEVPVGLLQLLVNKSRADVITLIGKPSSEYERAGYLIWEYQAESSRIIIVQFPRLNPGVVASVVEGFDRNALIRSLEQGLY